MNDDLPEQIALRLRASAPGRRGQSRFAPELSYGRHHGPPAHDTREAAVLVLFYRQAGRWFIPLTLRPGHMVDHAGQVCFPGGLIEPDETAEAAALRELHEEVGVAGDRIRMLGRFSPLYVFNSNFRVVPCVAATDRRPRFQPNPEEVAELVELPLAELLDATKYGEHEIRRGGIAFRAPHIVCGRHRIWGATCMMLGEVIELLRNDE